MRALLFLALLLASAPARAAEGLIDFSTTDGFPSATFPKGKKFVLHKDPDLGVSLVRVDPGELRGTYQAQAATLSLILHSQYMHLYSDGVVKVRRGDFILDHAGEVNGGWRCGAKSPFEMLLVVIPSVFPKRMTAGDLPQAVSRGQGRGLVPIAAARAKIDRAAGPARRMTLTTSPGLKVELLRLAAAVELDNATSGTSILFPVEGGALVGKDSAYLGQMRVYLMAAGKSLRIKPYRGKPFYAILISPGA